MIDIGKKSVAKRSRVKITQLYEKKKHPNRQRLVTHKPPKSYSESMKQSWKIASNSLRGIPKHFGIFSPTTQRLMIRDLAKNINKVK